MFDAVKFGVGIVAPEGYTALEKEEQNYSYFWKYEKEPSDELQEKEMAEDLMDIIKDEAKLETYIPRYLNQAIIFTGEDMGSDQAMMTVLLYIVIVIMAFVFGVTVSNTITKEANVIGTLRASGYTKGELIRHYMTMPLAVTLVGALIGNILGYTVCKDICAGMYYGSYSLPTYHTIWSAEAFWKTTLVPVALMAVVNAGILYKKLSLSPLQFLRRDLKKKRKKRTFHLSSRIPFFTRFRLRVIFQNVSNYVVLLAGILFANLLLMFGLALPAVLDHYQSVLKDNLLLLAIVPLNIILIPYVADYPMNLIPLAKLPEEVRSRLKSDFRLIAEYVANKGNPEKLKEMMRDHSHPIRHPEEFLDALGAVASDRRFREVKEQMNEEKKEEGIYMCTVLDEYWELGIEYNLLELICKKLKKGKSQEVIAEELEQNVESIQKMCQVASAFAPEYDRDQVYDAWKKQKMS